MLSTSKKGNIAHMSSNLKTNKRRITPEVQTSSLPYHFAYTLELADLYLVMRRHPEEFPLRDKENLSQYETYSRFSSPNNEKMVSFLRSRMEGISFLF